MSLADAWSRVLDKAHREALDQAFNRLCDESFEDYVEVAEGKLPVIESSLGAFLPRTLSHRFTPLFHKRYLACFLTVGWKLAQQRRPRMVSSCVAEELALYTLIRFAESPLEVEGIEPDFDGFCDVAFQDTDFEWLLDPALDGIEGSELAHRIGTANLAFEDWFRPFNNASTAVHPYAAEDGACD